MCDPVTTMIAGARALVGVAEQQQRAAGERAQLDWQAALARNRAALAEYGAREAEQEGERDEDRARRRSAALLGAQQARLAAQGSDLAGSPVDLLADLAASGEEDALERRWRSQREAWARRQAAGQYRTDEGLFRARSSAVDPTLGTLRSLLSGF
jgi:hypothetical protein